MPHLNHTLPSRTGVIDANMHWLPETLFTDETLLAAFLNAPPREYGTVARLQPLANGSGREIVIEQPKGKVVLNYAEHQYSLATQLADMDRAGVDRAVFRMPCWQEWLPQDVCQRVNDLMAAHVARSPARFSALAVVPPWDTKEARREVERCIKDLGFVGVQMAAHYGQLYLDDEAFRPWLRFLHGLGVPVVVHHTPLPVDHGTILDYTNQRRQYGRCVAQATAVGRELFSGLFDELPRLRFVHSMLGGGFFAYANMLCPPRLAAFPDAVDRFDADTDRLRTQLRQNLFFDISGASQWGPAQLRCAVEALGADNILYSGSYPIRKDWFFQGVDDIRALGLPAAEEEAILGGNARRLFGLD